ncbi:MAG: endonuclease III [Candidatus Marsarchaeota archaeon]|jgi:endonuclease-3|nr:endonuclease III [Candidatus Marsarchaeota archaeon]MCL5111357.1 endonuclease III [Candidatus Marsarchaeota archaeon]
MAGAKLLDMASAQKAIGVLKKEYPNAKEILNFSNPLEMMVAIILAARSKDETVNACTKEIFKHYRTAKDYASAKPEDILKHIHGILFAANKVKSIINACKELEIKYNGKVPSDLDKLVELPGIGRKSANTILINAFGIAEGIPADTHVVRVSYRLGLTASQKPDAIEADLMKLVDKKDWGKIAYVIKFHGRAVCKAPVPMCSKCALNDLCPRNGVMKSM